MKKIKILFISFSIIGVDGLRNLLSISDIYKYNIFVYENNIISFEELFSDVSLGISGLIPIKPRFLMNSLFFILLTLIKSYRFYEYYIYDNP